MKRRDKKSIKNNNSGITVIALVITVIVLIILAGIAISSLTGDNNILQQAARAKETTEKEQIKEEIIIAWNGVQIDGITNKWENDVKASALQTELKKADNSAEAKLNNNSINVKYKGYETTINVNSGSMTELAKIGEDDGNPFAEIMRTAQKHPNQKASQDIGIDAYGKIINLDYWGYEYDNDNNGYKIINPEGSIGDECYLPLNSNWEEHSLYTGTLDKYYVVCPQYIKKEGDDSFKKVTTIGDTCFHDVSLKKIVLPSTVVKIERMVFDTSRLLKSLELPPTVKQIGEDCFLYTSIKKLKISSNIQFHARAFHNSNLTSIVFGDGCDSIQSGILSGCSQLYRVYFDSASLVSQVYSGNFSFGYNCPVDTILIKKELYDSSKNSIVINLTNSNNKTFYFKGVYDRANNTGADLELLLGSEDNNKDSIDGYAVYMSGNTTSYNPDDDGDYDLQYDEDNDTGYYPKYVPGIDPETGSENGSE